MDDVEAAFPSDFSCIDYGGGQLCSVHDPQTGECPTQERCEESSYTVRSGVVRGFDASYDEDTWKQLVKDVSQVRGPPRRKVLPPIIGLQSEVRYWDGDRGEMAFVHMTGLDFRGGPIDKYSFGFTPELTFGKSPASPEPRTPELDVAARDLALQQSGAPRGTVRYEPNRHQAQTLQDDDANQDGDADGSGPT